MRTTQTVQCRERVVVKYLIAGALEKSQHFVVTKSDFVTHLPIKFPIEITFFWNFRNIFVCGISVDLMRLI